MATSPSEFPIFDGEHYDHWSKVMKHIFKSQDLWDVVVEGYEEAEKQYNDLVKKNETALRFIRLAVGKNIYPTISRYEKAKDAWEILQKKFKGKEEKKIGKDWVIDIGVMLGCLKHREVLTCSISRVTHLRKAKEEAYSPKVVSIGPFHYGNRSDSDLQLMEETKWRYMQALLRRGKSNTEMKKSKMEMLENCTNGIRRIDPVVRASYGGNIKLTPEELARIMLVDGCFILELLLKLFDHVKGEGQYPEDGNATTLSDLSMLENQIPFIVLKILHRELSEGETRYRFPSFKELAKSLFDYNDNADNADSSLEVFHFLHLMHLSSIHNYNESDSDKIMDATQELKRCASKLQASGIKIQAGTPVTGNIALNKFVDKFDMNIKFVEYNRTLTIPPLHIKEGTEVKWRNLIAWENSGIKMGYKFTSYALFFSGLICSVHDIELLKAKNIVRVEDPNIRDEDLLALFTSIADGVKKMDSRYSKLCKRLNGRRVDCVGILHPRMWWHYWRRVLEWLRIHSRKWIIDFRSDYMRNPWVFMGVIVATILLGLTIAQTVFAALGV